jgi:hypothetical protein
MPSPAAGRLEALALQPKLAEGLPGVQGLVCQLPLCLPGAKSQQEWVCVTASCGRPWWRTDPQLPGQPTGWRATSRRAMARPITAATRSLPTCWPPATRPPASTRPLRWSDVVRAPMERGLIAFVEGRSSANSGARAMALTWTCANSPRWRPVALWQGTGPHAGLDHHRAQPVAHPCGDRLAQHPATCGRRAERDKRWRRPTRFCAPHQLPGHTRWSSAPRRMTTGGG